MVTNELTISSPSYKMFRNSQTVDLRALSLLLENDISTNANFDTVLVKYLLNANAF